MIAKTSNGFTGFRPEGFTFLSRLRELQEVGNYDGAREFYLRDKRIYEEELKLPLGLLMEELAMRLQADGLPFRGDRKSALFRINRDVRFSPDKSPYKTHCGAVLTRGGTRKEQGVLYFHVDSTGCLMAAGFHMPEPGQLAKLRGFIRDYPDRYRAVRDGLSDAGLPLDPDETLKRLPRGFEDVTEPDLAVAVKLKEYIVVTPVERAEVMEPDLLDKLAAFSHQAMPLLQFGWDALDRVE